MRPDYEMLGAYLHRVPLETPEVTLTFAEVERIVGAPLPASHLNHRAWWANQSDTTARVQARAWTDAGFQVQTLQQTPDGWVTFRRL